MAIAFTFPGQGSQRVGMGAELADSSAAAREVFEEVDDALGQHLSRLMRDGPEDELTLTENAQPALMAVSLAVVRALETEGRVDLADKAQFVAGHSLGEYSALAAAGSLSVADTARLLKRRGRAMQEAVPVGEGAMAAVMGLDLETVRAITDQAGEDGVCAPANDNADGQVVISGHARAVERAIEMAKGQGAKRAVKLPVSAPFHCSLMQPAADAMAEALAETVIAAPAVPLVSNVTADSVTDPDAICDGLVRQVTAMVRWRESVAYMAQSGVDTLAELGAGKVLSGLAKRINRDLKTAAAEGPGDIEALLEVL